MRYALPFFLSIGLLAGGLAAAIAGRPAAAAVTPVPAPAVREGFS
jgi:hypothetical protein